VKRIFVIFALLSALAVWCVVISAEGFAIGDVKLTASSITIEKQYVKAVGNPKLSTPDALIAAKTIEVTLVKGTSGKLTIGTASAIGGVTIQAKQVDKATKVSRNIDAASDSATFRPEEDKVVLTGNARVKIGDPDLEEPAVLTGEIINIYLKTQKIEALGQRGAQAELNVKPKPKPRQ